MRRVLLVTALSVVVLPATAHGAFPGANGKIAFTHAGLDTSTISVIDPDGTDLQPLTSGSFTDVMPAWSPDGTRIAFASNRHDPNFGQCGSLGQPACDYDIHVMNQDGSSIARVTGSSADDLDPAWSPDGSRIVFTSSRNATEDCGGVPCGSDLYTVRADGSGVSRLTSRPGWERDPAWSPDGTRIAEVHGCQFSILDAVGGDEVSSGGASCVLSVDWSPDGARLATVETYYHPVEEIDYYTLTTTNRVLLETTDLLDQAAWSPDGTRIAFYGATALNTISSVGGAPSEIACCDTFEPDWQPLPVNTPSTHIRPKSAQQFSVPLVPASKSCANPNREHGPPLAFGSCSPPVPQSGTLTAGVGGTSAFYANSSGLVRLDVAPGAPGGADDSDVALRVNVTSVWRQSGTRVDYNGELQARIGLRTTDKDGTVSSTIEDRTLAVNAPCTTTPDDTVGSTCAVVTTADAVSPGLVPERTRAVWELEQVRVFDGGPDGDADTAGDNSLFMTQGVFVP